MDLQARAERLARLMGERLDIPGRGLEGKLAHAGRRLPRHIRAEAELVARAISLREHPKLARMIDERRLARACRIVERHLLAVDPWARRRAVLADWILGNILGLLVMAALVAAVLAWRGYL